MRQNLPGRGHADEKLAAAGEQFFCEQHHEGGADGAADNTKAFAFVVECVKLGVIGGPAGQAPGMT